MKKLFISFLIIISFFPVSVFAQAQMENAGFENWENVNGNIEEPVKWNSLKTAENLTDVAPVVYDKSTDAHSGDYSLHLFNLKVFGTVANGMMTSGRVHIEMDKTKAYTYTDTSLWAYHMRLSGRPDSVVGWFKYIPQEGDIGMINFDLHLGYYRKPARPEDSLNLVGAALFETPDTAVKTWTRFSVPFKYFKADTLPEYIHVVISSGNSFDAKEGSEMWLDDMELIYNTGNTTAVRRPPAPQGELQSWFSAGVLNIILRKSGNQTYRLSVIDMTGRVLYNGHIASNGRKQLNLNAEKGIYIVHISNKKETSVKKVFAE